MSETLVAVDLGATSGRVIRGHVTADTLTHETVHRFPNGPVTTGEGLHWDVSGLYEHILTGLSRVNASGAQVASVGIDSWAVDYGLLSAGELINEPFHYRDERTHLGVEAIHNQIPFEDLFHRNGLQFLPFNTVYQLACEQWSGAARSAERFLLIPDLIGYWLTGVMVTELTNASTTGLLTIGQDTWNDELIALTGAPRSLFGDLVAPGLSVGGMIGRSKQILGSVPLITVGSHDTASAVAATPLQGPTSAYISLGTWGLVGVEVPSPILSDAARQANFTNERAIDGRVRFLKNVMGLWIVNECVSRWQAENPSIRLEDLVAQAAQLPAPTVLVDVSDPVFAAPGDMPSRVSQWLGQRDASVPSSPEEMVNILLSSLASAYASAVVEAGALAGIEVKEINVVGGGSQNAVLCQRIADEVGVDVVAGPVEATAMGNLMVQAQALGIIPGEVDAMRDIVRRSVGLTRYSPARGGGR